MTPPDFRLGEPSPLIFHLSAALAGYAQALMAAPRASEPGFPWAPPFAEEAARLGPALDQAAVAAEIGARLSATVRGMEAWQTHPYRRAMVDPPALWSDSGSRLLDYGQAPEATDPGGPPVLVVPSLINRAYVLDLMPGASMMRGLAALGLRPTLLDWGAPGPREAGFSLDDYGARRLAPALAALEAATGRRPALVGYCMGGAIAAGFAARRPGAVSALGVIGAPWDFASTRGTAGGLRAMLRAEGPLKVERRLDAMAQAFGLVPVSLFQWLFALVNPMQAALKFQKLSRLDPDSAAARHFVALEDWLADGTPMALRAARTVLIDWQIRNLTAKGLWRFLDGSVDPRAIRIPTIAFCGQRDSIAPPALTHALPQAIRGARIETPRTGHVGMIIGSAGRTQVWRPLADFVKAHVPS